MVKGKKKVKRKKSRATLERELEATDRTYMHAHGAWKAARKILAVVQGEYNIVLKRMDKADDAQATAELRLDEAEEE